VKSDDLVDVAALIKSIRTPEESRARLPYALSQLREAARSASRLRSGRRRLPGWHDALAWARESALAAPLTDDQRDELLGAIDVIEAVVGTGAVTPG
jgi:hypothetical protein